MFADGSQKVEIVNVTKPVVIIDNRERITAKYLRVLPGDFFFIRLDLFDGLEVALIELAIRITDQPCCTAHQQIRLITMLDEMTHHHRRCEIANLHTVSTRIHAKIEFPRLIYLLDIGKGHLICKSAPRQFF